MKSLLLIALIPLLYTAAKSQSDNDRLSSILQNIDKIKTASYRSIHSSSAPYDTTAFHTYERLVKMYINSDDTINGAKYSTSFLQDPLQFDLCYDGTYSVRMDWEDSSVQIDTLKNKPYARPMAPFFIKVKALLEYSLENPDSAITQINSYQDSTIIRFQFPNKSVEFMGKNPFIRNIPITSRYELFIDKNRMPYKLIRKMPHQTSCESIYNLSTSDQLYYEFNALLQIPIDFEIEGAEKRKINTSELEGEVATEWTLKEAHGDSISLGELKSRVLLIQFTGIGCGPCHASLPFLKQLVNENKDNDFELISIETWSNNLAGIERYKDKNELNYKFLMAKPDLKTHYKIGGVPSFFILDKDRVIRKVIVGYQIENTEAQIKEYLAELIE